ncbi:hypothetical protein PWT90_04208 [Aphanocladium album]|nr:hypothetical protein PWT90_04208 [Aphanocladium album]
MTHQQPSLEAKKAFFTHFQILSYSDDEEDAGVTGGEGQTDSDELDPQEQRMRHRHQSFFRKAPPPAREATSAGSEREPNGAVQATPDDDVVVVAVASSTKATPVPKSRGRGKRDRNVVDELLGRDADSDVEFIGETPVVDQSKRAHASSSSSLAKSAAPSPLAKRLPPRLMSTSSSSSSSLLRVGATVGGSAASTTKKRKKDGPPSSAATTTLRPESEQIFRGLVFYYVPDNEIAGRRRLRMHKAREYGAARTSDPLQATHVIVDKDIGYKDAERAVAARRPGKGTDGVVIVNEDYPIECVQFRAVLDATQKRYRLTGQPDGDAQTDCEEDGKEEEEEVETAAREMLQIKEPQRNPKKWDYVPKSTPPNASEESPGIDSQPIVLDAAAAQQGGQEGDDTTRDVRRDSTAPSDELTKVIDMMQEFKDLPLDNDDEEDETGPAGHGAVDSGSDDERPSPQRKDAASSATKADAAFAERFACARAGSLDAHASNPNARTVEVLSRMLSYYERTSDPWRTMAYRKAVAALRRQPARVATAAAARRIPGVGPRLAAKIEEIATTDRLRRLEYAEQDDGALPLFLGVYGVGPALAARWAARGLRTLEDVKREVKLTPAQMMGIDRYKDLNTKIPRDEVEALADVVRKEAALLDGDVQLIIGGSYRRGAPSSSDVDFIVTKPDTDTEAQLVPFLQALVRRLQAAGFLVATLAADGNIWQGCCVLPKGSGTWRRMDFLLVPASQLGAALIYFTGDDVFNRSLRLLAQKRGMKLNQRGLYRRVGGKEAPTSSEEDLLEGRDERRIFDILGVEWREPTQRWC